MKKSIVLLLIVILLQACGKNDTFLPGGDARENPPEPQKRVKKNLEEGKGFRLDNMFKGKSGGGDFEFASSNELWRASLDTIDFIPLISANYSGGIIISDWYSEDQENFIKITIRFLSNEVRSDAIDIKIFYKLCDANMKCVTSKRESKLVEELKTQILKKAAVYQKQTKDKNFKPYKGSGLKN
ncbi:DUF3576 domain-containing protein [Candidatus Pelagibacter sp. FZCC0015]|uniref:DUF3576 domain-containing protein n=1 Tax=Candidatus Pelagibacter sp. FZCC0015 TaxID=2268451 RepID=UPI0011A0210A|nr:DUF3576 domain-containing protein [Candidatus Pelagibacter sp. FZCC0015]